MAFPSGKSGFVRLADSADGWPFKRWRLTNRAKIISRNNFESAGGKDESVAGFQGTDIVLEGPFDDDPNEVLEPGETYAVELGIDEDGPLLFTRTIRVEKIELDNDAEDAPNWVVSGPSHGDFEPTVPETPD